MDGTEPEVDDIGPGSVVIVRPDFGLGDPKEVTVLALGEKNDRRLFDYTDATGARGWAYYEQVVRVLRT